MLRITLAASLIALVSAPSLAQDRNNRAPIAASPVVTVNAPSRPLWTAALSRSLGEAMRYPRFFFNELQPEGTARVRFACSESGTPAGITLVQSSGDRRIDRAALDAVRRIKTLHPLPNGMAHDQRYVAALVFATSPYSLDRQMKAIRKQDTARVAGSSSRDIALVVAPGRVNG